jgi:hypothetical protein
MSDLARQQCSNHPGREAIVRCPSCHRDFCRECVTEHDDRVVCSACLKKLTRPELEQRPAFGRIVRVIQCALGILIAWFFFFLIGESLLKLPDSFHEGTLWQLHWIDKE